MTDVSKPVDNLLMKQLRPRFRPGCLLFMQSRNTHLCKLALHVGAMRLRRPLKTSATCHVRMKGIAPPVQGRWMWSAAAPS